MFYRPTDTNDMTDTGKMTYMCQYKICRYQYALLAPLAPVTWQTLVKCPVRKLV